MRPSHSLRLTGVRSAAFAMCVHAMLGCRNTALHDAASSKLVNRRGAMVSFLIAERADVNQANKKGCVTEQRPASPHPCSLSDR